MDAILAHFARVETALRTALVYAETANLGIVQDRLCSSLTRLAAAKALVPTKPGGMPVTNVWDFKAAASMRIAAEFHELTVTRDYAAIAGRAELNALLETAARAF